MSDRLARPAITAKTDYLGLSWLKFIAALLVIANHTGPFAVFGSSADFLVDGALTRIAVPIFFMTSGFFYFRKLTGDPLADRRHLRRYLGSIAKLYAIAILLYVPLNVYNGYFSSPKFGILSLLRDLAFDGTFYHLWYLPALMIGIAMLHGLYRALKPASVMIVACLLYAVGLFGDSYYGLIAGSGVLTGWYNGMFHVFDYTRNGLFFAPVYLALGAFVARSEKCRSSRPAAHAALFLVSLSAMLAEALWLREGGIPGMTACIFSRYRPPIFCCCWRSPTKDRRAVRCGRAGRGSTCCIRSPSCSYAAPPKQRDCSHCLSATASFTSSPSACCRSLWQPSPSASLPCERFGPPGVLAPKKPGRHRPGISASTRL